MDKKIKAWELNKTNLSIFDISKDISILRKKEQTKWLSNIYARSLHMSLLNLDKAYKRFFKTKKGFPKFKSKHSSRQSCSFSQNVKIDFKNSFIILPKIKSIKTKITREFVGEVKSATLSKTPSNKYFISILVETNETEITSKAIIDKTTLGIDLGIKDFAIFSNRKKISNPKTLQKYDGRLKKEQRRLSRKKKGSNNWNKQRIEVAKIHEKITNTRKDFLHKLSYRLTHENQVDTLVLENLNVSGMLKNHNLAKSINDCSWSEFRRQLEYKSRWYGKNIIIIDRFEPTSKTCSNCGCKNDELQLKDRFWFCENCNTEHDRDINAAINIKTLGLNMKYSRELRN